MKDKDDVSEVTGEDWKVLANDPLAGDPNLLGAAGTDEPVEPDQLEDPGAPEDVLSCREPCLRGGPFHGCVEIGMFEIG